jgi:transcriptional regulator with XRE-family HTH domain
MTVKQCIPSPETVAVFVRLIRGLRGLKKQTLSSDARVSLSTLERIERGEVVSAEKLDKVAQALGYDAGYFTSPRTPLSPEEAAAKVAETWGHLIAVPVHRVTSEGPIRKLGRCHACLIHRPGVGGEHNDLIVELGEWLEAASWINGETCITEMTEGRKRAFYTSVIECVRRLERSGLTILAGSMKAPQQGIPGWTVGVVSITDRKTDPGAVRRRHILVDIRNALPPDALANDSEKLFENFASSFRTALAKTIDSDPV